MARKGRNFVALLFALLAVMPLWAQFAGGSGTESDPWLIATRTQLEQLNNYLGADHSDKHFLQTADIDLGGAPWIPIGRTTPFYGDYNGDGHNIGNLNISDYLGGPSGLFAYIVDATIENVFLINVWLQFEYNFYNPMDSGGVENIAPLVVYSNNSDIHNCHATGSINVFAVNGYVSYISGLVCHIEGGHVSDSSVNCSVNAGSHWDTLGDAFLSYIGGIACENNGNMINCKFYGDVYCMGISIVAPFMAYLSDVGGVVGNNLGSIVNCTSTGKINGGSNTGGLVGMNGGTISRCWSNCVVNGNDYGQGGFVGVNLGVVNDSYAHGSIGSNVYTDLPPGYNGWGGFAGYNGGSIISSFSYSCVSSQDWQVGGFVGSNDGSVAECYWNIDNINENTSMGGGDARTTDDMTYPYSDSTYVGWDFTSVWCEDTQALYNNGYPFHRWRLQAPHAYFYANGATGFEPLTTTFINRTMVHPCSTVSYLWDFGDGFSSTEQNPQHIYSLPGQYSVSLTVTNEANSSATYTRQDYVSVLERVPALELLTNDTMSFGSVFVEESSGFLPITISSTGGASVTITSVHFMGNPLHFELLDPFRDLVVEHGETDTLWVRFAPHAVGTISDTLYIVNDSVNEPLLKVKLTGTGLYVLPQSPQSPTITVDGDNINLSWDAVTLNMHDQPITPDYYFVYISDDPYEGFVLTALTPDLSYTHPLITIGAERTFYRISAVKFYRDDLPPEALNTLVWGVLKQGMEPAEVAQALRSLWLW